jgi:hypothetical protein
LRLLQRANELCAPALCPKRQSSLRRAPLLVASRVKKSLSEPRHRSSTKTCGLTNLHHCGLMTGDVSGAGDGKDPMISGKGACDPVTRFSERGVLEAAVRYAFDL